MMAESAARSRTIEIVFLAVVLAVGIFLRLPPHIFTQGGPLRSIALLHPAPGFTNVGFDEGLYRQYVRTVIKDGVTSYPDLVEGYIEVQKKLPGSILPP